MYADWLDESGDEINARHAKNIRFQCDMARIAHQHRSGQGHSCPRCVAEKQNRGHVKWAGQHLVPPLLQGRCTFSRGFVDRIACTSRQWLNVWEEVTRTHPVEKVAVFLCFGETPRDIAHTAACGPRFSLGGVGREAYIDTRLLFFDKGYSAFEQGQCLSIDFFAEPGRLIDGYGLKKWFLGNDRDGSRLVDWAVREWERIIYQTTGFDGLGVGTGVVSG